jgi:hypothetical protein
MTLRGNSARRSEMLRKFWSLLLIMIASSLVVTATVHAQEILGSLTIECSGTVHSDGDADQSQGDSDNALPHHHGSCHSPSLNVPATDEMSGAMRASSMRPFPASDNVLASRLLDPALRPPAA